VSLADKLRAALARSDARGPVLIEGDMREAVLEQVAFPGGRIDPGEDAIAAALREAEEEIALPADQVELVGPADRYVTVTGFQVTPVIGVVPPDLPLAPSAAEVADWFEAPLEFLLDPANHLEREVDWQGRRRRYYEILWNERRIWGATAAMIVNLARRLRDD
jgi:8-oxo-dGTP pyrophosphatase MutT (NUDIX family)